MYVVEGERSIMATSVAIITVHPKIDDAKDAVGSAFDQMRRIEHLMSIYKEDAEVSILNRNGFYENASGETTHVIARSVHYSRLSEGAFSIAVLPLLGLWEDKLRVGRFPTKAEIDQVLELVDYRNVVTVDRNVRFMRSGMRVTLGGIAKGYAIDKAIEYLTRKGLRNVLVNAGGDIRAVGEKAKGFPWRIAVRDPRDKRRSVAVVELRDQAIATSGSYERRIGKEMNVSHIINSRTGQPAQEMMSATVISKKAIDADALSTVVFLLGVDNGMDIVERLSGVEALVVTNEGKVIRSSGYARFESS